jgi:hypothetical protein
MWATLIVALVAPISGLVGSSDDLDAITFTPHQPVRTELSILDVSITGHVLAVTDADEGSVVVLDLEGEEVAEWTVPNAPRGLTPTAWSPDGSVVVFGEPATEDGSAPSRSTVRTLDVRDGTLSEIDPIHNGTATLDFFPAWSHDGALMFLRAAALPAGMNESVELVTQEADGDVRSQSVDLTPGQLSIQDGAVLAGR